MSASELESLLQAAVHGRLQVPPSDSRPGSIFKEFVELEVMAFQGLSQMDCEDVAATAQAGVRRPEAPPGLEAEFIETCGRLRDASSNGVFILGRLSTALDQFLQTVGKVDGPSGRRSDKRHGHSRRHNAGGDDDDEDRATERLTKALMFAEFVIMDNRLLEILRNELVPAFSDPDLDGLPTLFDSASFD